MMFLIKSLIFIFVVLFSFYIFKIMYKRIQEGVENNAATASATPTPAAAPATMTTLSGGQQDPAYVATVNSANIAYLQVEVDKLKTAMQDLGNSLGTGDRSLTTIARPPTTS